MKKISWVAAILLVALSRLALASGPALTVFHDPSCGCCVGWIDHMKENGFQVKAVQTQQMDVVKSKLGVPAQLSSCHTAVLASSGQLIEGHVPAHVVHKMLADSSVSGVAAPGMPHNAPGMGPLDGTLLTVDLSGKPYSLD